MVLGYFRYPSPCFLCSVLVFAVVATSLKNLNVTGMPSAAPKDRISNRNISIYLTQIGTSKSVPCLWHICKHGNDTLMWIFRNGNNRTSEAFGANKQKNGSTLARIIPLCCRMDKGLRHGGISDCDIFAALCEVDLAVNLCQASCSSENTTSQDPANESCEAFTIHFNLTKEECRGILATNQAEQSSVLNHVQSCIKSWCTNKPKQKEKLKTKCCSSMADFCPIPTSPKNGTMLKSAQSILEAQEEYDRTREVEDYIHRSIISLVACVLMVIGVFLTVMTYNLWSSRKRYQDSLKVQNIEQN